MEKKKRSSLISSLIRVRAMGIQIAKRPDLTERERRVLFVLLLMTFGYGKKRDCISASQIAPRAGLRENNVWRTMKQLKQRGIIGSRGGGSGKGFAALRWINVDVLMSEVSASVAPHTPAKTASEAPNEDLNDSEIESDEILPPLTAAEMAAMEVKISAAIAARKATQAPKKF